MNQPVKLSNELLLDARLMAKLTERSIASQVEFWARLGRAVEPLLNGERVLALKQTGDQKSLSSLLATVDHPEGRQRVSDYLVTQPYPHYEVAAGKPGMLVRIEKSGTRTIGRFVNREFQPLENVKLKDGKPKKSNETSERAKRKSK